MADASWDGERGGFDDFEYIIEEAKFGYNAALDAVAGRNVKRLNFNGTAILGDGSVHPSNQQGFTIGDKFDIVDGGARAVHESGEDRMFHYQSGLMTMVRAARACGAAEVLEQRCQGDPLNLRNADVWVGLKFRFQRVGPDATTGKVMVNDKEIAEGSFKARDTGETVIRNILLPTEFLGEVGGPSISGGGTAATGADGSTQPSTKNGSGSVHDLEELAKSLDKMDFLDVAVRERGMDISDAEVMWDKAHA